MASPIAVFEDRKSNDLEIVSVGALYSGSWDKKYWSSSRGKDRFPYPVGYKAARAHNENKYYMEIEKGAKGPLFLIRCLTESWTGPTPDIAWEKFQKSGFSHLKLWHGKRFTCKMSGMEFFGFKNPLVQRMLRELVTNSHGIVESSSSIRASQMRVDDERPVMFGNPTLLCHLDVPVTRKKRSRKPEIIYKNLVDNHDEKKSRFSEISNSAPVSACSTKGDVETVCLHVAPPEQLHSIQYSNENSYLPSENPPQVKVFSPSEETDRHPDSSKSKPLSTFSEELQGLQEKINKPNDDIFLHENQDMTGSSLCAPDTLDFLRDNTISSAPKTEDNTSCMQKEKLTLSNVVVGEGVVTELNAVDSADSTLNMTSKNNDYDTVDQGTANSMLSFLLPQAIPLFKKALSKKPPKNNLSDNCKTSQLDDVPLTAVSLSTRKFDGVDESMQVVAPDSSQDLTNNMAIAPDSFDESNLNVPGSGPFISSSREAYKADLSKMHITEEQVAIINANLSVSALETIEVIRPSSHHVGTMMEENNQDEFVKKSMSKLHCTSSTNTSLSEDSKKVCAAKGNLSETEHHSKNKEANNTFCSTEGNGIMVGTALTEVGSIRKENLKVYSKKRVSTDQQRRSEDTGHNDSMRNMSPTKILEFQPTLSVNCLSDQTNPVENETGHVTEQYQGSELVKASNNTFTNAKGNEEYVVEQDMRSPHAFGIASILPSSFPALKFEDLQANTGEALGIQVSASPSIKFQNKDNASEKNMSVLELAASSNLKLNRDVKINNEMEKTVELLGCYFHPMPVSSVLLKFVGSEIYICVLTSATVDKVRTLFMYKISAIVPSKGFPSVIGQTPAILPIMDNNSDGNRTLERSYLHITPDGEHLIITGDIKTPYCSKREIDCSCVTCTSACFEENAVRIVQVKTGHVSLVAKLQATDCVKCVLVCDPNYVIAVVKCGNLIVWAMDSQWRGLNEEFVILANPCVSSCIVKLKKIPKCPHLVIGHNGIGEFTIWDISKRSLVSRFVSPSNTIFEFIPTSLFAWHPVHSHSTIEEHVDMILAATKLWFSKGINNKTLVPAEVKDTAIWLLVSTDLDSDATCDHVEISARCWRLALLVKNQVILGSQLDPRVDVVGTVSGHGVAGTLDGLVYMWDLSTGAKLGSLHDFKGRGVSCISSDDSDFRKLCIASEDGQLLVYCHPEK